MRYFFALFLLTTSAFAQTPLDDAGDACRALLGRANYELIRTAAQAAGQQRQIADLQKQIDDLKKPKDAPPKDAQ